MKVRLFFLALLLCFFSANVTAKEYQVVFETLECSGESGFATVEVDAIYKVESADCFSPDNPEEKLKKLLVHDGSGSYIVYTLTQEEAKKVMADFRQYMKARLRLLEKSDMVIIKE